MQSEMREDRGKKGRDGTIWDGGKEGPSLNDQLLFRHKLTAVPQAHNTQGSQLALRTPFYEPSNDTKFFPLTKKKSQKITSQNSKFVSPPDSRAYITLLQASCSRWVAANLCRVKFSMTGGFSATALKGIFRDRE